METVDGIGRAEALTGGAVTLTPAVAGQISEILANLGDMVHRGDAIVRLDTAVAAADLAEKEAQRDTLKAALELLAAEPRPEDRRGPELAVEQAKLGVEQAEAALNRLRPLHAQRNLGSPMVRHRAGAGAGSIAPRSGRSAIAAAVGWSAPEALAEAKARLTAAEQLLAVAQAQLQLHELCAPIDGVLDALHCHPGQAVAPATPLAEIVDSSRVYVTVWFPAATAERIKLEQAGTLRLDGSTSPAASEMVRAEPGEHVDAAKEAPDAKDAADAKHDATESKPLARVVSIGRVVDPQTGNLPVRLLVENSDSRLAIGQTVGVSIVVAEVPAALVVPQAAVFDVGEGPRVMVVREGKIAHLSPESAVPHGKWNVILGTDLKVGEPVVIDGGFNLPEGTAVKHDAEPATVAEAHP